MTKQKKAGALIGLEITCLLFAHGLMMMTARVCSKSYVPPLILHDYIFLPQGLHWKIFLLILKESLQRPLAITYNWDGELVIWQNNFFERKEFGKNDVHTP